MFNDAPQNVSEDDTLQTYSICSISDLSRKALTLDDIVLAAKSDKEYLDLISNISNGFPSTRSLTAPELREFWHVRENLAIDGYVAYFGTRIIVPRKLRKQVLEHLHSAHQGTTSMKNRAAVSVYWPGLNKDILNYRNNCRTCDQNGPSLTNEPIIQSAAPEWPFQQICGDYFFVEAHSYLVVVDRYSGWPCIYHFPPGHSNSTNLVKVLRELFTSYGTPEEFSSDGGPQLTSKQFDDFLKFWGVHHRLSSVEYPQSNGRAELGVKSMKRLIRDNANRNGSLDNERAAIALLQYRNTPLLATGLSPAQILFHRQLKDALPTHRTHYQLHPEWILSAKEREACFANRNKVIEQEYNLHTRPLDALPVGTHVLVQRDRRWRDQGVIVATLPFRQYQVRMLGSGRVTLRNRKFLKRCKVISPVPPPSAVHDPAVPPPLPRPTLSHTPDNSTTSPPSVRKNIPRALRNLADYNNKGLTE